MRLLAIADLHLSYAANRRALEALAPHPDDWLLVVGDVAELPGRVAWGLARLARRFARVVWVPGNHELWTHPRDPCQLRGEARYRALVDLCRELGVLTPEDPWPRWPGEGPPRVIAPLFLGYDYSFAPDGMGPDQARAWALEAGIHSADEHWLHADPWPGMAEWCAARCRQAEARLEALPGDHRLVLVNHWPLRRDLARLPRIPRFVPWCGTRRTGDWHRRWPVEVVVTGHLHVRATDWRHGVRFEEVSLGYPRHWEPDRGLEPYLRDVLAPVPSPPGGHGGPFPRP